MKKYNSLPRPLQQNLGDSIKALHDVLLMMENDEENYHSGCNWGYVKSNTTLSQIKDNYPEKQLRIESSDGSILTMKKDGSLASRFLTHVRNGFAHNCITYNSISSHLTFDVLDSVGQLALRGEIPYKSFIEIIRLIKESKQHN